MKGKDQEAIENEDFREVNRLRGSFRRFTVSGAHLKTLAGIASKEVVNPIAVATHGRSGISLWFLGSTADRILRSSCVPVLMVRAVGCVPGV